jgi:hypothetical protein
MARKRPARTAVVDHKPSLDSLLLLPAVAKIARGAATGETHSLPSESALKVAWSQGGRKAVERWLHSGDLAQLGDALQRYPFLAGHPAVFKQLQYIHRLTCTLDAAA